MDVVKIKTFTNLNVIIFSIFFPVQDTRATLAPPPKTITTSQIPKATGNNTYNYTSDIDFNFFKLLQIYIEGSNYQLQNIDLTLPRNQKPDATSYRNKKQIHHKKLGL